MRWRRRSGEKLVMLGAYAANCDDPIVEGSATAETRPAASSKSNSERELVNEVLSGEAAAARNLFERMSGTLWSVVTKLEGDGPEGEAAFLHVVASLKADGYARLKGFDGRARLATYLSLVARDILADRVAGRFSGSPHETWNRFARFFEADIRSRVARQLPRNFGKAAREDAYQEVCLKLIENDFRRIRSYEGRGSFAGYVLTVVDRILIDLVRRDVPRRRLPAGIARSAPLDQAIYAAVVWDGCPRDAGRLAAALRGRLERDPTVDDITEALARVAGVARLEREPSPAADAVPLDGAIGDSGGLSFADSAPTPEDCLLLAEEERSRASLVAAVKAAADDLPADERLYLQIVFSASEPLPARDIARLMGCPVETVYRLKQRAQRWLKQIAVQLEKNSDMSV
jgi:RNA polymerase primary sigma factor